MMSRPLSSLFPLAALLAGDLLAQSFTYTDFSNPSTLALLGNAAPSGTALRLTANASNQTGWAWHRTAMPVLAGFDTTFTFRITPPAVGTKAEGMAFVLHDDPNGIATLGGTVWGMGYGSGSNSAPGIRNSIAVELDTFQDGFLSDSSANELTIHTRGPVGNHENEQYSIGRASPGQVLSDGQVHTLRIRYVPGTIDLFVDNATTPILSRAFSFLTGGLYANGTPALPPTLASGAAFLGFCATTGAGTLTEQVDILSWSWTSTSLNDPCYAGTAGQDTLSIAGSTGGPLRKVALATFQPFTIGMQAPTSFGPGAPWVLLLSTAPNPGAPGTALGFGNLCMPPFGGSELILADSTGQLGPLVGAAPFTIPIPAGIVTSSLDVTVQGVIGVTASPFALAVTNAIDVAFRPAPAPTISSVAPLSALPGQTITVTGSRILAGATLLMNGAPFATISSTPTAITFAYPAGLPCGSQVAILNPDGQSATSGLNPVPNVTGASFSSGVAAGNQLYLINGSGFAPGTTVTIGGALAAPISASTVTVLVRTPPGTVGVASVVITTPGGCTATTTYTYL